MERPDPFAVPLEPDPAVLAELRRRAKGCPADCPPYKWVAMNRAERRARSRKGGRL